MGRWGIVLLAAGLAAAQQTAPVGIVRGTLIERDEAQTGELIVRLRDNRVYSFQFDARTYVEKEKKAVAVKDLATGDTLEILSDAGKEPRERYARTVKVVTEEPETPSPRIRLRRRAEWEPSLLDQLYPRGNLTFAGIVASVGRDSLLLRTRDRTEKRILLRRDTRYLREGVQVDAAALGVNTRVFVRAGKNLYDEVEAYQVIWGDILKPDGP
jgi:hypothetical protein